MAEFNRRKKKVCMMCTKNAVVDYKDPETLKRYTNEIYEDGLGKTSLSKYKSIIGCDKSE